MSSAKPKQKSEVIQFIGVSELKAEEQEVVNKLSTEYYEKIKRDLPNLGEVVVQVKCYEKEGNRKKYSMHVRVVAPTKQHIESTNADDWDLAKAVHIAFESIKSQIHHKFHTDVTRPR